MFETPGIVSEYSNYGIGTLSQTKDKFYSMAISKKQMSNDGVM